MTSVIVSSPHISPSLSLKRLMLQVIIALVPGTFTYAWLFGPGVLINIGLAIIFALGFEGLILKLRQRPVQPHLTDLSAVVAAWLFALCLPMHSPWWLVLVGVGFMMTAGKHLYGGLGFNPFNPAMVGYVVLLISFPLEMTTWYLPISLNLEPLTFADALAYTFGFAENNQWDAYTAATPMDHLKTAIGQGIPIDQTRLSPLFGQFAGKEWEWVALGWLLGGFWLLFTGTIRWHIPVSLLAAVGLISSLFFLIDSNVYASPLFHLLSGAALIGAFFIATDPVTASTTNIGRIIYGGMIGLLIYIIRVWGGYPDGVGFAVLLANLCVPLIDYCTQPRVYGEPR